VPLEGAFPLSTTRDSIGPLGHSAQCCIWLDQIMAGERPSRPATPSLKGLRFGVPQTILLDGLAPPVAEAFQRALTALSKQGAVLEDIPFSVIAEEAAGNAKANFSAVEAYALHRERLATQGDNFDPNVRKRLLLGAAMKAIASRVDGQGKSAIAALRCVTRTNGTDHRAEFGRDAKW
jgi:aspartyl-tRNA(Asn)/glutamyl-tRNA(Gln) amidotransferase subunit A